jgi:two-component system, response regulator RegA
MSTKNLLLVDDDDAFRTRLGKALRRFGFSVCECGDAREAIGLARGFDPGYAVVDLRMPHLDGLQILTDLMAWNQQLRVVLLTGYGNIATAMEAVRKGAFDFLIKPCECETLVRSLHGERPFAAQASERPATLERLEWEHIHRVLTDQGNNVSQTARILGIDRRSLQRKLAKRPMGLE